MPAKRPPGPEPNLEQQRMPTAHSLQEAASSEQSLEGYVAINHGAGPHGDRQISHDEIAELAYRFYEERNGRGGSAEEDWHRAEQELRRRNNGQQNDIPTIPGDAMNL